MGNARRSLFWLMFVLIVMVPAVTFAASEKNEPVAKTIVNATSVIWQPTIDHESLLLTVIGPDDEVVVQDFSSGRNPSFQLPRGAADGAYRYEIRVAPRIPAGLKKNLQDARAKNDDAAARRLLRDAGIAWHLTANASASGGSSKFSIEDITGSKVPFTVTAGAATNSIFVDSTGRVGFRTSTPVLDLHVSTGNTPALRFEQTNASGFTAQTWDMAGNEANFFVRDVTGGSRLPFRIRPGAPTSSIDISASGNVGIGTASPGALLDVNAGGLTGTVFLSGGSGGGSNVGQLTFNRIGSGELGRVEVQRNGA